MATVYRQLQSYIVTVQSLVYKLSKSCDLKKNENETRKQQKTRGVTSRGQGYGHARVVLGVRVTEVTVDAEDATRL